MLMGKAADFFQGFWVSKNSLKTKGATPMDLRESTVRLCKRRNRTANSYDADKIKNFRFVQGY